MDNTKHTGNVIQVENLVKKFGDFTANKSLSFHVEKGEVFGFLGANGAGKTTAMRILCGLSKPTSGTAIVAGYDVGKQPEEVKMRVGYMSQKFSLYDDLTVWENMRLYAAIYGLVGEPFKQRVNQILNRLELYNERNRLIRTL